MMILLIAAFAGAVHMLAPDHWMPVSLVSWQRRWRAEKSFAVAFFCLTFHVALALGIYLCLRPIILASDLRFIFPVSIAAVILAALVRGAKFDSIRDVLRIGPNHFWGSVTVLSLLGPSESLIPVLIKARMLEQSLLPVVLAYAAGTLVAGLAMMTFTQTVWNSPRRFNQTLTWAMDRRTFFPAAMGVAMAIVFILRP